VLAQIYGLGRFGMTPGLERITPLLHRLGDPQKSFAAIHVAGTNGKGSTASFLAAILEAAGHPTGLFSSPHLTRFTERFRVRGTEISAERLAALAERVLAVAPPATTFFEVATALACLHFAEERVRLAVLEVGMGGRYDATNAVDGVLAVITPIALDHCAYLGDTLAAIAGEKAGIIRPCRPVISAAQEQAVAEVIGARARLLAAPLSVAGRDFAARWEGDALAYRGLDTVLTGLSPGIGGRYQAANGACALAAAEQLRRQDLPIPDAALRAGLAAARWPGRMEHFPGPPRLLLDGAHNPAGAAALATELQRLVFRRLFLVVGLMGDKDAAGILAPLLAVATDTITVAPALDRALAADDLATQIRVSGFPCRVGGSVADGLALARSVAHEGDLVVVCGSLFVVGEARAALLGGPYEPIRG
jgi:dihydrofolate synthase/folylpolyglutamate synthase